MDVWLTTLSASGLADMASRSISPSPARQVVGGKWTAAAAAAAPSNSTSTPSTSAGLSAPGNRAPASSPPKYPSDKDRALLPQEDRRRHEYHRSHPLPLRGRPRRRTGRVAH